MIAAERIAELEDALRKAADSLEAFERAAILRWHAPLDINEQAAARVAFYRGTILRGRALSDQIELFTTTAKHIKELKDCTADLFALAYSVVTHADMLTLCKSLHERFAALIVKMEARQ